MKRPAPDFPWTPPTMDFEIPIIGFEGACERFAANQHVIGRGAISVPLSEALNWAAIIDYYFKENVGWGWAWRDDFQGGDTVRGLRFARNVVHHQYSLATLLTHYLPGRGFDFQTRHWRWLPAHLLPEDRSERGEDEYEDCLSGQLVTDTLDTARQCFAEAAAQAHPGTGR